MPDNSQLRDAVARLVRQLEIQTWTNSEGKKITDNIAFLDVKRIIRDTR